MFCCCRFLLCITFRKMPNGEIKQKPILHRAHTQTHTHNENAYHEFEHSAARLCFRLSLALLQIQWLAWISRWKLLNLCGLLNSKLKSFVLCACIDARVSHRGVALTTPRPRTIIAITIAPQQIIWIINSDFFFILCVCVCASFFVFFTHYSF